MSIFQYSTRDVADDILDTLNVDESTITDTDLLVTFDTHFAARYKASFLCG